MPASTERPIPAALIPWVFALVALLGLNAFTQDYSRTRKDESNAKAEISQPVDVPMAPGNFTSPLVFLIPHSTYRAAILDSQVLSIVVFHEEPLSQSPQGAVRGRAPPARLFS